MFREMRRQKQSLTREACTRLLKTETRGVLSMIGDDGYPYGVPINHYYCEEDGRLYFHGGKIGHRIDAVKACDKVCYTVYDKGVCGDDGFYTVGCVIAFGRMSIVGDVERALDICRRLCYKFTDSEDYIAGEIEKFGKATLVMSMDIEHMTGKLVQEK